MLEKIALAYSQAKNYPDLAKKLIEIGIESYTVDVATDIVLYRAKNGQNFIEYSGKNPRNISESFNQEAVKTAIIVHNRDKTPYSDFMDDIAKAGVRFYEATLVGDDKRCTYIGINGYHEEIIPI